MGVVCSITLTALSCMAGTCHADVRECKPCNCAIELACMRLHQTLQRAVAAGIAAPAHCQRDRISGSSRMGIYRGAAVEVLQRSKARRRADAALLHAVTIIGWGALAVDMSAVLTVCACMHTFISTSFCFWRTKSRLPRDATASAALRMECPMGAYIDALPGREGVTLL